MAKRIFCGLSPAKQHLEKIYTVLTPFVEWTDADSDFNFVGRGGA